METTPITLKEKKYYCFSASKTTFFSFCCHKSWEKLL